MRKPFRLAVFLIGLVFMSACWASPCRADYVDNGDGTVTDAITTLMWDQAGSSSACAWKDALSYCENLKKAGYTDWRLPDIQELQSLADKSRCNPAIDPIFQSYASLYWSGTSCAFDTALALSVNFKGGYTRFRYKSDEYYCVRCVRGGHAGPSGTLALLKSGTGSGRVTSSPFGIDCGADCKASFKKGTEVVLNAASDSGSDFTGWSGGDCSGTGSCSVTIQDDLSITAKFTSRFGTLIILKSGTGTGMVTSSPAGIDCGEDCKESYEKGTGVVLTATADSSSGFMGWSGGGCSGTGDCFVTIEDNLSITAKFSKREPLNIVTKKLPPGELGVSYSAVVSATGGILPYKYAIAYGKLPDGLILGEADGKVSGTPIKNGSFTFGVGVTDVETSYAEKEYTVEITEKLQIVTASPLPRGTRGIGYFESIQATGGTFPYTFTQPGGSLPLGMSLSANGDLSGTPYSIGLYQFTVRVTDDSGRIAEKSFDLQIIEPVSIRTSRLDNGVVGQAYKQTLEATGGIGSYRWTLYAGVLPAGLSLDVGSGVLSGKPKEATCGTVVVAVYDQENRVAYRDLVLQVGDVFKVLTASLPNGLIKEPYSEAIRTSGGIEPFSFSSTGLPAGLVLDGASGVISGKPTSAGSNNVWVTVTDSTRPGTQKVTQKLGIRISSQLTIITSAVLPPGKKGEPMSPVVLVAGGGASPYRWILKGGYLPDGVILNPQEGGISGTPLDQGDFVFTVEVADANQNLAQKEFFLHVSDTLALLTGAVPDGAKGVAYSYTLEASGGMRPYTWRMTTGRLPDGLAFNEATGTIYGSPSSATSTSFTVEVHDSDHPAQKVEKTYVIEVLDKLFISTGSLPNGRVKEAYKATIQAQLGKSPYHWRLESGELPPGLNLTVSPTMATLEGAPSAVGSYEFTLEATDSGAPVQMATRKYTVEIYERVSIRTKKLKNAYRGEAYSDDLLAVGGALPYRWQIVKGSLPTGLSLNSTSGHLSGVANVEAGQSRTFTVRVTDSSSPSTSAEQELVILVVNPLKITTDAIQKAKQGSVYKATLKGTGGIGRYQWSVNDGSLPDGLTLNASGVMAGTPKECGAFDFTVKLQDSAAVPNTATRAFRLEVVCK